VEGVPVYKKGDKTDCSNYLGMSQLSTSYKIVSSILLRVSPYVHEIIGDHEGGFRHNRSTTDQICFLHSSDCGERKNRSFRTFSSAV
jgi:hypothetical protein